MADIKRSAKIRNEAGDDGREAILATLERNRGHRLRSAKDLGIGVRTLGLKLKRWKEEARIPESV